MKRWLRAAAATAVAASVPLAGTAQSSRLDQAFERFWAAAAAAEASGLADEVARSGVSFDEAYRRLRQGRPGIRATKSVARRWSGELPAPI